MFRSAWIDGRATFTIVASRTTMNCARQTRQRTSHGIDVLHGQAGVLPAWRERRYGYRMPPKKRNWIQEERRKTLGDYTCFCLDCGAVWRYFLEGEGGAAGRVPALRRRDAPPLPACSAPFPSAFAVECEECGAPVRPPEVLGVRIRKPSRCRRVGARTPCRSGGTQPGGSRQQQHLDRLLAALHLHGVERLRLGAPELLRRLGADRDAAGGREALDPGAEVDRVADRCSAAAPVPSTPTDASPC